jgi:hypothetical protein
MSPHAPAKLSPPLFAIGSVVSATKTPSVPPCRWPELVKRKSLPARLAMKRSRSPSLSRSPQARP